MNVSTTCGSGWVNRQNSKTIALSHANNRPIRHRRWYYAESTRSKLLKLDPNVATLIFDRGSWIGSKWLLQRT